MKDEILNRIALKYYGKYFNQIYRMDTRANVLEKGFHEVLNKAIETEAQNKKLKEEIEILKKIARQ